MLSGKMVVNICLNQGQKSFNFIGSTCSSSHPMKKINTDSIFFSFDFLVKQIFFGFDSFIIVDNHLLKLLSIPRLLKHKWCCDFLLV